MSTREPRSQEPKNPRHIPVGPHAPVHLSDGGIETSLIFHEGIDLPDFAAFVLLEDEAGRAALVRYYEPYIAIALRDRRGIVLETATWRASADWGTRLGWTRGRLAEANRRSVELLVGLRTRHQTAMTPIVISGCIGPRGDGYVVGATMSAEEAQEYHQAQVDALADAGAEAITGITMTYSAEAIGLVRAARSVALPAVVSFTVETDGTLPSGELLGDAIDAVDAATGSAASYFMVNCAHPTHFAHLFDGDPTWAHRIGGIRANASAASHAELDEADELDAGDPLDLADRYAKLRAAVPSLTVFGGCCGTDDRHIDAISAALG